MTPFDPDGPGAPGRRHGTAAWQERIVMEPALWTETHREPK